MQSGFAQSSPADRRWTDFGGTKRRIPQVPKKKQSRLKSARSRQRAVSLNLRRGMDIGTHHADLVALLRPLTQHDVAQRNHALQLLPIRDGQVAEAMLP